MEKEIPKYKSGGKALAKGEVVVTYSDHKKAIESILTALKEEMIGHQFEDPAQAGQFSQHSSGFNQGLEEAVDIINQAIKEL